MSRQNDDLAYGQYYESERGAGDTSRGFGDTFKKLRDTYKSHSSSQHSGQSGSQGGQPPSQSQSQQHQYGYSSQSSNPSQSQYQQPQYQSRPPKEDKLHGFLGKIQGAVTDLGTEAAQRLGTAIDPQAYAQYGHTKPSTENRFGSFAPPRQHNDVKSYVDGCSYFWAVSRALENARDSIWIMDWWLSPELYLRRPPAKNEQYRLDRMLQAAAQRGVRINIIVYKEVTQALTLSSSHTKHHLEDLHPNIAVFRHPDHLPDRQELTSSITSSLQNLSLDSASLSKMPKDVLKGLYGMNDDVILYWAHHEKLCLIDGKVAFMGGLDLCFGRWDTNQHAIADVHPSDINQTVFPGQDYNNSRVLDFQDVVHWENNQLDRKSMSRMGWSDVSLSLHGAVVEDLRRHFVERWNFIYDSKYKVRNESRYARLALHGRPASSAGQQHGTGQQSQPYPSGNASPQTQQPPTSQGLTSTYPPPPAQESASQQQSQQQPAWSSQTSGSSTYPPPSVQASASQQPSQQQPAWSGQTSSSSTYPPPPGQGNAHQDQQAKPQELDSYQAYQPSGSSTYPPPPGHGTTQQTQQAQQQQSPSYQAYQPGGSATYSPQSGQATNTTPQVASYQAYTGSAPQKQATEDQGQHQQQQQSPPPSYQASDTASQGPSPYTYSGDSFPPPPPGAPPNQASATSSYQPQHQSQAPYYPAPPTHAGDSSAHQSQGHGQTPYYPPPPGQESHSSTRGIGDSSNEGERGFAPRRFRENLTTYGNSLRGQLAGQIHTYQDRLTTYGSPASQSRGNMSCQIVRSCAKWSNGSLVEHSIADAYAAIIKNSEHFVYIENQFFITATGESQHPVKNKIGAAIVERILRAARAGQKYKIVVVIPSVPCFAGDLRDDETLGTRAIMEFQYNSINRGGNSIMELIAKEGFNPMDYIRFYNLRNYDRINNSGLMASAEQQSGINYEAAQRQYDVNTTGPGGYAPSAARSAFDTTAPFQQYQQAAHQTSAGKTGGSGRWDSVSSCYMLGGEDIRKVPWDGHPDAEIEAFVSEELYVHSKVMIADDRIVICGSANLNDRSQLGDHDSEIAVIVEDFTPVQSNMNGKPWVASRFASSLRRELFRKHLGLVAPQDFQQANSSFEPVGVSSQVDFDSPESKVVADPLSDTFQSLWNSRARTNTEVFRKVFHAVPDDNVRNWATYKEFFEYYFHKQASDHPGYGRPALEQWGHVVRGDFAPGAEGAKEVKELLSQVKGTLVEMPLMFLIEEDIAKEGVTLNDLTEPLYT